MNDVFFVRSRRPQDLETAIQGVGGVVEGVEILPQHDHPLNCTDPRYRIRVDVARWGSVTRFRRWLRTIGVTQVQVC